MMRVMNHETTIDIGCLTIYLSAASPTLITLSLPTGAQRSLAAPVVHLDGVAIAAIPATLAVLAPPQPLANGTVAHRFGGPVQARPDVNLEIELRVAVGDPVVRLRYTLTGAGHLTKVDGRDALTHLACDVTGLHDIRTVALSAFNELTHAYQLDERPLSPAARRAGHQDMGPILVGSDGDTAWLLAYEHGSMNNDPFLRYHISGDHVELRAVKGHYCANDPLPYHGLWLEFAGLVGGIDDLAIAYRRFVLEHLSLGPASRKPAIFYNTWNHQERVKAWHGKPYLHDMHEERMLAEIDVAARMGIDVFVVDTGWFQRCGDWEPSPIRFPNGIAPLRDRLTAHGMRLGLWFGPQHAGTASRLLAAHEDCRMAWDGKPHGESVVWETEPAVNGCVATRFAAAAADEMIRCHREYGATYFKWDAIGQGGCNAPDHGHGDGQHSAQERADRYAFLLPLRLVSIVERMAAAVPQAIVDFDITEGGRAVGLAFLTVGKYFLINNGPYYPNYDLPPGPDGNSNLFFWPGDARAWICRQGLSFDRWIPSVLHLVHYLPDDPPAKATQWMRPGGFCDSLEVNLASLMLGHNGIWGDLLAISDPGVTRIRTTLDRYKRVRDAITHADPVRSGAVGASPEIHEKLSDGRGLVCLFAAQPGTYTHITTASVIDSGWWAEPLSGTCTVERLADGHARITATFTRSGARAVLFGT